VRFDVGFHPILFLRGVPKNIALGLVLPDGEHKLSAFLVRLV
tara:strand:- start:402 stop:527 length:126 start_codon:yes stop_codon:yes gene_type:complete